METKAGDVFLIPLTDGEFSIGQVIAFETRGIHCISCGLFNQLASIRAENSVIPDESQLFSTLLVSHVHILKGTWPVVNNLPVKIAKKYLPYEKELRKGGIGARIQSPGIVESFVDAFFCKKPWNMYARTNLFDELLLDPSKKPKTLIYK